MGILVAWLLAGCGPTGSPARSVPPSARAAAQGTAGPGCARPPVAVPAGSTTGVGPDGAVVHSHAGPALPPGWPADLRVPSGLTVLASAVVVQPCGYQLRAEVVGDVPAAVARGRLLGAARHAGYRPAPVPKGLGSGAVALHRGHRQVVVSVTPVGRSESYAVVVVPFGAVDLVGGDT